MTLERFLAVIDAAGECLSAFERLAGAMTDLTMSKDLAGDINRLLTNTELRPATSAIVLLELEKELCSRKEDQVKKNREAVRKCREGKKVGRITRGRGRPPKRPPEAFESTHYEEIIRKTQAESPPTIVAPPKPLGPIVAGPIVEVEISARPAKHSVAVDATPKTGETKLPF